MIAELLATKGRLVQLVRLDHGAHGPVHDHDALLQQFPKDGNAVAGMGHDGNTHETEGLPSIKRMVGLPADGVKYARARDGTESAMLRGIRNVPA